MATLLSEDLTLILHAFERNKYFYGKLMTVRDFDREQAYINGKRWLINRLVFGSGVVCGLEVLLAAGTSKVLIKQGVAIDPCGREIVVPEDKEYDLADLRDASGSKLSVTQDIRLCIAYDECIREPVPALKASTCEEVCDYSRVQETFTVQWRPVPQVTPAAEPNLCQAWLNSRTIEAGNAQVRVERITPVWVGANDIFEVAVKVTVLQNLSNVSLTETITGGMVIEPTPTPPNQFPTPQVDLKAGEFFLYVYQVQAGSVPGPVTIALGLAGATPPTLSSSIEIVPDAEAKRREEFAYRWLKGCGDAPGDLCVELAEMTVGFTDNTISSIQNLDNLKPRRLIYNLERLADLLECMRTNLLAVPGSPRPGHAFITFKDLETAPPKPVGPVADPGSAYTVSRGDHTHALLLAEDSGLEFTPGDPPQLKIDGPVGGENIDFRHPVRGQDPTEGRHLVTKQYVDARAAGIDWQESVLDKDLATPPAEPPQGARYLLFSSALSGDWSGQSGSIVTWTGTAWAFTPPNEGMAVFVEDENRAYIYVDGKWIEFLATPQVMAGDGLKADGAVLSVGQGSGIIVNPDDVTVAFETGPPQPIGPTAHPGTANTVSRSDHVHPLPLDLVPTHIATGVVVFEEFAEMSGQVLSSTPINPGLGQGPISVLLGFELGQRESILVGSLDVFADLKASGILLGAIILPRSGEDGPPSDQFRVRIRVPEGQRGTYRVRWWAYKPSEDRGEVRVPRPVEPPVRPPVEPPVEPPVRPPVEPPVRPPVEPPVRPPVEPPVRPPVEPPVRPPVEPPVRPPVEPPVGPVGLGIPVRPGVISPSLIGPLKVPEGGETGEVALEAVDGVKAALARNLIAAGVQDVEALFQGIDEAKKLLEQA